MHFNTKYIFQSDSRSEIAGKINYNFDQILSFGVGPNGHMGPRGATGLYGPAGYRGIKGGTGIRGSQWFKQPTQPLASQSQAYDVWVDNSSGEGDINVLGPTGAWVYSNYSFFNSTYFSAYSWILGPAGSTEKYAIGFKSPALSPDLSLVINDGILGQTSSNPNRSKVVVSTQDQTTRPIMSFGKSGAVSSGIPSFLWSSVGSYAGLVYNSTGSLDITSYLGLTIDSGLARTLLFGNNMNISASSLLIRGDGDFDLFSNTTVGSGGVFKLITQNLVISSAYFNHIGPLTISTSQAGTYALNNVPATPSASAGIWNDVSASVTSTFSVKDKTGNPVLSGKPYGPVGTSNHTETIFGSTGGFTGGTAGPYAYHVKRAVKVSKVTENVYPVMIYPAVPGNTLQTITAPNVFDLTATSNYNSNVIVATPTSYSTGSTGAVYIRVPASISQNLPPVYEKYRTNIYRILLDNTESFMQNRYIAGIIFSFTNYSAGGLTSSSFLTAIRIPGLSSGWSPGCQYIDLHWISLANPNNSNPRLFYRTCNGIGGYVDLTNLGSVGTETTSVETGLSTGPVSTGTSTTSSTSGGGGGGGGGGCPTPDMPIMIDHDMWMRAGDLRVGTQIYTLHEKTNEWGYYKISHAEILIQPVVRVTIGNRTVTVSDTHRFLTADNKYVTITNIKIGTEIKTIDGNIALLSVDRIDRREIVKIEVEEAHTYVVNGMISHNNKIAPIEPTIGYD